MSNTGDMSTENQQMASEMAQRIAQLADFDGDSLKYEMAALKKALLENPSAAALLHDEDIGKAVQALRRMTGTAIANATVKKTSSTKTKKLSMEELEKQLALIPDDEL